MDKFVNALSRIFDDGKDRTLSFLNDFDFGTMLDDMVERGKNLRDEINEAFKDFKESITDFTASVPFDEANETVKWEINDDTLTISVKSNDGRKSSETTVTIPNGCVIENAQGVIDRKNGMFVVTIPKDKDNNDKAVEAVNRAKNACRGIFKSKKHNNVKKTYVRDSKGRFAPKK